MGGGEIVIVQGAVALKVFPQPGDSVEGESGDSFFFQLLSVYVTATLDRPIKLGEHGSGN
jgi:hypothetical protein